MTKITREYSPQGRLRRRLKKLMKERKCNDVEQFCDMYDLDHAMIKRLYTHPYKGIEIIIQICEHCDVSADWLLETEVNI
jgi:hypothetical protein